MNNVPAIRFNGFSGDWENDKFGSRLDIENGYAFKSIYFQDITNSSNSLIVLTPGNVHIGGGFQKDKGRNYSEAGEIPSRFILKPGDIFVTMTDLTPTAQTLGYPAVVPNDGNTYLLNQRLGKIVNFEGDAKFLLQILSTEQNHKQIVSTATGTTVKHSSPQKILSVLTHFPSSNEQTQIGSYFQHLDKLISLHQTKVNKLTNLKKAMLEKMFPKLGADVPEIRYKGFEGAWEEWRLGEYAKFRRGSFPQPYGNKEWYDGDGAMPFVQVVDVTSNLSLVENTKQKISLLAQPKSVLVKKGAVVVTLQGSIGRVAILQYDAFVDRTLLIFESFENKTDMHFWAYLIQEKFDIEKKIAPGGTIKTITKEALSTFEIKVPDYDEQEKIGTYFQNLDKTITLHQTELEKLGNLKKACLENMFV